MKISSLSTFLLCTLGGLAQQMRIVSPTPNTRIVAGQPFNATVAVPIILSSVDVVALVFGAKIQPPDTVNLGQITLVAPSFPISSTVGLEQHVELTFPVDMITGLNRNYNGSSTLRGKKLLAAY